MEQLYQILAWVFSGTSLVGVLSSIMWWRTTKRSKEAEVKLQEIQTKQAKYDYDQKRIDDLHKIVDIVNTQLLGKTKECENKEVIIADKTARIREKDEEISRLTSKLIQREQYISTQQRFIDWLKNWHCKREYGNGKEDCRRREPEQRIKVSYDPPPELEDCDLPVIAEGLDGERLSVSAEIKEET